MLQNVTKTVTKKVPNVTMANIFQIEFLDPKWMFVRVCRSSQLSKEMNFTDDHAFQRLLGIEVVAVCSR